MARAIAVKLVDFHTHFFSRPFFEALAAQSPLPGSSEAKLQRVADEARIELPSQDLGEHLARWLSELDKHGVDHLVSFASAPEEVASVGEAAAGSKGRMTPFAFVNPKSDRAAERLEELLSSRGFKGCLVFPAMHHFEICGPEARPVLQALERRGGTVIVHCGVLVVRLRDRFGLPRAFDLRYANPLSLIPAANAFPGVNFVIPHFGAGLFRETLIAGMQCPNIYVDSSSSNGWIATQAKPLSMADVFERALGVFGPDRILFGTDSNTFPAGWRHERRTEQKEALGACGLRKGELEKIFSGNAERLLGLGR